MKRLIFRYTLLALFSFLLGFMYNYHLPAFKVWLVDQIDRKTNESLPIRVTVSNVDIDLIPLSVKFKNIRLLPNSTWQAAITNSYVDELEVSANPFSLLTGLFDFIKVTVREPKVHIINLLELKKLTQTNSQSSFDLSKLLDNPIDSFTIWNLDLFVEKTETTPQIELNNFSAEVQNQKSSALISLIAKNTKFYDPQLGDIPASFAIGSRILIQQNQILLSALKIQKGDSYILAAGYSNSPIDKLNFDKFNLKIKTSLKLNQIRQEIMPFLKSQNIPQLHGTLEAQTHISKKTQDPITSETKFYFKDFQINQFYFGQVIGQSFYQNNQLRIPIIQLKNNSGTLNLNETFIELDKNYEFRTQLNIEYLQLQELLKNLGLGEVKVQLSGNGKLPCYGQIVNTPLIRCKGQLNLNKFRVYNEKMDIVQIDQGSLDGEVEANDTSVITKANIKLGQNSAGFASGTINYKTGFKFNYETDAIDFSDAKIANLDLLGKAKLSGTTAGDSHAAIFDIQADTKDFSIKKYFLGDLSTLLEYRKGILSFKNADGLIKTSKYLGQLQVNLNNNTIKGDVSSPYLELSDLQLAFDKIVKLPIEIYGGGTSKVQFEGPLEFHLLSYNLKSQFMGGSLAGESFDRVVFNVTSNKGHVRVDEAYFKKSSGLMTLQGTARPNGNINTLWIGKNFPLQSISNFERANLNLDGILNFSLSLKDHILSPNSDLDAKITETKISQEPMPDSSFNLKLYKDNLSGNGKIFGEQIDAKFIIPYSHESPFMLNAKVQKWDFVPLLHLISSRSRALEFKTLLTGEINLSSPNNGFWNSTGSINLSDFRVQRGNKEFFSPEPVQLKFNNGFLNVQNFFLRGDNTSLEFTNYEIPQFPLSFSVNGKIDLGLLSFLTPFFDDFRGDLALATQFGFKQNEWKMLGSAYVSDGYIRVDTFPHPLENIEADFIFNNHRILVNKFISQFASGKISGEGQIELEAIDKWPTILNGKFSDIQLKVPNDVTTRGSGEFKIFGDYFPYTLQGMYVIQSGLMQKQFDDNNTSESSFNRIQLLPASLVKKTKEIIILDMDTIFTKGFDIRNDLIDSRIYGKLKIKGPPTSTVMLGQIQFQRNGKLFFRETPFEIETGEIRFNNPNRLNGDMYISANAEVEESRDNRIQRYDINMLIQGRLDNYRINLSSNPPRSEKDIISLLALGVTTESYQTQLSEDQIQKQSYEVGASILTKNKFGRQLKSQTGLDFKVSSAIDQKSKSSAPKITVSKQWSNKLGTSASRTFGESSTNDLKVEYQLNKNMSVIGSWEGKEATNSNTQSEGTQKDTTDVLGLDLEYKFEFK